MQARVWQIAWGEKERVSAVGERQGRQVGGVIHPVDITTGTAIARFDDERIVLGGNLGEETGMSDKVRGGDGQTMRARHGDGDGFVTHEADGARAVDGRDTDRFCRFKKTEPGAL